MVRTCVLCVYYVGALVVVLSLQHGTAPLHVTCLHGHSHIAKMLIERGADIDVQTKVCTTSIIVQCVNYNVPNYRAKEHRYSLLVSTDI